MVLLPPCDWMGTELLSSVTWYYYHAVSGWVWCYYYPCGSGWTYGTAAQSHHSSLSVTAITTKRPSNKSETQLTASLDASAGIQASNWQEISKMFIFVL